MEISYAFNALANNFQKWLHLELAQNRVISLHNIAIPEGPGGHF